jgi:hypothetical protein
MRARRRRLQRRRKRFTQLARRWPGLVLLQMYLPELGEEWNE